MLTLDRDALHAAILANPADDLPRLAYADWLEEYGDAEAQVRARFIRVQLRLANCGRHPDPPFPCHCESCTLTREEGYILGDRSLRPPFGMFHAWTDRLATICRGLVIREANHDLTLSSHPGLAARFRRGFLADLVCYPQQWFDHHAEILNLYPLERVAFIKSPVGRMDWVKATSEKGGLPRRDLAVSLVGHGTAGEIVVPAEVVAALGSVAVIEGAKMRLCRNKWPGLDFRVCKGE